MNKLEQYREEAQGPADRYLSCALYLKRKPKRANLRTILTIAIFLATAMSGSVFAQDRIQTANGKIQGISERSSGIRSFKGIPFASSPVGDLRWRAPQPA